MKSLKRRGPQPPAGPGTPPAVPEGPKEPSPAGEWKGRGERYKNETHFSSSDPDARLFRKGDNRASRLSYLAHDLIDTRSRVVLRRKASLATGTAERDVALEMLDEILDGAEELGLVHKPEILSGDAGYGSSEFLSEVLDRGVQPHVPLLAGAQMEEVPSWKRRTFKLEQQRARQRKVKEIQARNRARAMQRTRGYQVSRKLRIRSEHVFAEGKNQHGLGRARRRGRERVEDQLKLTAVVQNLKRLASYLGRSPAGAAAAAAQPRNLASSAIRLAHIRRLWALFRLPTAPSPMVPLPIGPSVPRLDPRFPTLGP